MDEGQQMLNVKSTFGCVYRPHIPCPGEMNDNKKKISKLQKAQFAEDEYTSFDALKKIDPNEQYTINSTVMCDPPKKYKHLYTKCGKYSKSGKYKLLNMEDGKTTFDKVVGKAIKNFEYIPEAERPAKIFETLDLIHNGFVDIAHLMDAIVLFGKHNFIHNDIKADNIVYDVQNRHVRLIDFGVSGYINKKYKNNDYPIGIDTVYHPPELALVEEPCSAADAIIKRKISQYNTLHDYINPVPEKDIQQITNYLNEFCSIYPLKVRTVKLLMQSVDIFSLGSTIARLLEDLVRNTYFMGGKPLFKHMAAKAQPLGQVIKKLYYMDNSRKLTPDKLPQVKQEYLKEVDAYFGEYKSYLKSALQVDPDSIVPPLGYQSPPDSPTTSKSSSRSSESETPPSQWDIRVHSSATQKSSRQPRNSSGRVSSSNKNSRRSRKSSARASSSNKNSRRSRKSSRRVSSSNKNSRRSRKSSARASSSNKTQKTHYRSKIESPNTLKQIKTKFTRSQ